MTNMKTDFKLLLKITDHIKRKRFSKVKITIAQKKIYYTNIKFTTKNEKHEKSFTGVYQISEVKSLLLIAYMKKKLYSVHTF